MRSELIKNIFEIFIENDRNKFVEIANEIISDEERKNHQLVAKELKNLLNQFCNNRFIKESKSDRRYKNSIPIPRDNEKGFPLLEIQEYYLDWNDLIIGEDVKKALMQIVNEFRLSELFSTYGLKPKQNILFYGKPGTGKTLASKVISSVLGYPMVYIRFDSIVSSYLGETASNLRKIFDFIENGQWTVLFDEFDIIGKQRDDPYEHGEIKRVVNNFMQMIDNFKGESLIISATNHVHLLDSGLWRRFDDIIHFELPDEKSRMKIFEYYLKVIEKDSSVDYKEFAKITEGFSPADIRNLSRESVKLTLIDGKSRMDNDMLKASVEKQKKLKQLENNK